jgi:hypothetical protein
MESSRIAHHRDDRDVRGGRSTRRGESLVMSGSDRARTHIDTERWRFADHDLLPIL